MCHRYGEVLVCGDYRLRQWNASRLRLGKSLNDRREIRSRIGEEVFDAALGQERQISLRHTLNTNRLRSHFQFLRITLSPACRYHRLMEIDHNVQC